ncbi:MAG: FISUMP domain-containing protein [Candidatus Paceibacterota bacterium]
MSIKFRQPFFLADIFKKIRNFAVKGFSLVELLIVVAIVAILAVMFIPNIFSAKVSARDSTRTSDLNQFKAGLKMYSIINRGYPTTTDWISIEADVDSNGPFSQALNNPNFLSAIPRDPSYAAGGEYSYKYIATTTDKYTLCAKTEGKDGYVCIDQDNNSVAAQIAYVPGLGGTPPVQIIPTIALNGAAIASPYTESDANTRFPSGLQFDVTNAVSATVNGGAPVSLAGGTLTAVSNADAKTADSHSYYVVVTSSDGHTAGMTISYAVGSVFACGSVQGAGGLTYGTVLGPDGKCWLDRNLGATQVAASASDANAYGYYYQWGRPTDGHQVSNSGTTSANAASDIPGHANFITEADSPYDWRVPQSPNQATLWAGANGGSNNPCPTGWHVPTQPEWATVAGYFSPQTSVGAFNSSLKLPLAGHRRRGDAALSNQGSTGSYWSSSPSGTEASNLAFNSGVVTPAGIGNRAYGFSVRCVKDDDAAAPIIPTIALTGAAIASPYTESDANTRFLSGLQFDVTNADSATVNGGAPVSLAGGVLTAVSNADAKTLGDHSYHVVVTSSDSHTAEMTITYHVDANSPFACGSTVDFTYKGNSVSYGTVEHNGECWMDRNLGASQVATAYNDSSAYGDLFQWGRLDDGHQTRTSGVTTTLSNTDSPGHSNFIIGPYDSDWRSPRNDNLWQGVSGVNNPCPSGWRVPTEAEWTIEKNSWVNGAFSSPLKLAAGGGRSYGGAYISGTGENGWYWSSTAWVKNARYLAYFGSSSGSLYVDFRNNGYSVRCIKE